MGIYPDVWFLDEAGQVISAEAASYKDVVILLRKEPGLRTTKRFTLVEVQEERTDCFCCSCKEREGDDPACRNHGNDNVGRRPCEVHNMPGYPDADGEMPRSVQAERARRA